MVLQRRQQCLIHVRKNDGVMLISLGGLPPIHEDPLELSALLVGRFCCGHSFFQVLYSPRQAFQHHPNRRSAAMHFCAIPGFCAQCLP